MLTLNTHIVDVLSDSGQLALVRAPRGVWGNEATSYIVIALRKFPLIYSNKPSAYSDGLMEFLLF